MRKHLAVSTPEATLGRVLDAFEEELLQASDEEILEAARDLGMNPMMKGSAAFLGLHTPDPAKITDFFDPATASAIRAELKRLTFAKPAGKGASEE